MPPLRGTATSLGFLPAGGTSGVEGPEVAALMGLPVWRYHAFLTNTALSTVDADVTHRQHAIIETVLSDIIDGPLAHLPSSQFAFNSAWAIATAITHHLLRAAGMSPDGDTPHSIVLRHEVRELPRPGCQFDRHGRGHEPRRQPPQ